MSMRCGGCVVSIPLSFALRSWRLVSCREVRACPRCCWCCHWCKSYFYQVGYPMSASSCRARVAGAEAGAGLVSSKTSLQTSLKSDHLTINLSAPACAERRVRRLKRSVWASGHLHGMGCAGFRPPVCWFVTLTYKGVSDWRPDHMSDSIQAFRNWCRSRGVPCRYTWVGELQGRGAVHYHLLAWLPVGVQMPHWDRSTRLSKNRDRAPFWPHGMTNTEVAISGVGYLMKYLSKLGELTKFPKGIRLYGIGGLDSQARSVRTWFNLPEWAKCEFGVGELKRIGSRLCVLATGELLEPAYSCSLAAGCLVIKKLREVAPRFHDGAYSSVSFA